MRKQKPPREYIWLPVPGQGELYAGRYAWSVSSHARLKIGKPRTLGWFQLYLKTWGIYLSCACFYWNPDEGFTILRAISARSGSVPKPAEGSPVRKWKPRVWYAWSLPRELWPPITETVLQLALQTPKLSRGIEREWPADVPKAVDPEMTRKIAAGLLKSGSVPSILDPVR
jgi:hypothetical protein